MATIPAGKKPDAIAYDPATSTIWVMNAGSGDITVIDPATLKVRTTVAVGGSLELGAADDKGRLYVNVEDRNDVAVIDTKAMKLVTRFPLQGCDGPTGIAYAADVHRIISACANGVAIVSAPDGHQIARLAIGPRPDGALYDPLRKLAFVPSGGDGTLAVIRMSGKPEVVAQVAVQSNGRMRLVLNAISHLEQWAAANSWDKIEAAHIKGMALCVEFKPGTAGKAGA